MVNKFSKAVLILSIQLLLNGSSSVHVFLSALQFIIKFPEGKIMILILLEEFYKNAIQLRKVESALRKIL
jgi:hypothetical protein